eukprot:TRINITY_DN2000_c0_g1_i8.p1 TRINITY_DN2000_c0_g1~~TRINITY_DN2000_c0_g1_i8.p1  ORF type:complete len:220 (+),score=20.91 TRINITY_DN2000_c0_g1_i8:210-869(+)
MALRAAILRQIQIPVQAQSLERSRFHRWMSSHGDDHLDKKGVIERALSGDPSNSKMFGGFVGKDIMMKVGPRGGSGGAAWDDLDLGNVKKIYISHGSHVVNSIQTAHSNSRNGLMLSEKHGGDGDKFDVVNVDAKDSISWIKGSYTNHDGLIWKPVVITSLTIGFRYGPNYGPFGSEWIYGSPFHFWFAKGSSFCGFHGSADNLYLHSIGVHVKSVHTP